VRAAGKTKQGELGFRNGFRGKLEVDIAGFEKRGRMKGARNYSGFIGFCWVRRGRVSAASVRAQRLGRGNQKEGQKWE